MNFPIKKYSFSHLKIKTVEYDQNWELSKLVIFEDETRISVPVWKLEPVKEMKYSVISKPGSMFGLVGQKELVYITEDNTWSEIPMSKLNPVKDEVVIQKKDVYKVPIFKKGNVFVIWTGDGAVRYFNEDTLPDLIKAPLGIIMNSPKAAELNQKEMSDMDMAKGVLQDEIFKNGGFDKAYEEIGWQYNKYYYVVVLTVEELASVKGEEGDAKK